jgi:hypothetical protein
LRQFHSVPAVRSQAVDQIKQDAESAQSSVQIPDQNTNKVRLNHGQARYDD